MLHSKLLVTTCASKYTYEDFFISAIPTLRGKFVALCSSSPSLSAMIRSAVTKFSRLPIHRTGWQRPVVISPSSILTDNFREGAVAASRSKIAKRPYSTTSPLAKTVSITYVEPDGTSKTVDAEIGTDLMTVAHENDIELEGACGGELACSTCHLIFDPDIYETLPEKEDEEDDMLDLAFEVTETSRLGCQIPVQENFDGMTVQIPDDGF